MKTLIISDIHLRAYVRYNKTPDQRLYSFLELARDVVAEGVKRNINMLIITGDIIDKSTLSPREIHVLFKMFEILASQFKIYALVGNHDMKLKKGEFEKEDSIVTLLEEIEGVKFFHQEIVTIEGKTLAFENWMPEFKLDWFKGSVDYYFSHAAIDYDNTGMYGIDLDVFEKRFTLGFFGDIHVRREKGNLISVGNTKQESLSDRHQGGGIVLDIETGEWERFDIDPENVKYLKLITTEDKDLEGWKDFEGESMIYYTYKPNKSAGKKVEFTLPKTSDLEEILQGVMKDLKLTKLHNEIKKEAIYVPIDFNFKLKSLRVKNFRSIKDYVLNFENDYMITGPNGSGKSTLITALFYALVGKKTLKQDITKGEKDLELEVSLTYAGQTFEILRGTATGVYGLKIDGVDRKYNNKNEFEKEVYEYLPFIEYHETFFFNYWDTELLSSVKLDRRFDIISKFYRLDALNSYNDLAVEKLKQLKAENKTAVQDLLEKQIVFESKKNDLNIMGGQLVSELPRKDLAKIVDDYNKAEVLRKKLSEITNSLSNIENLTKTEKENLDYKKRSMDDLLLKSKGLDSTEVLEKRVEDYQKSKEVKERIPKGKAYLENLKVTLDSNKVNLETKKESLKLLGEVKSSIENEDDLKSEIYKLQEEENRIKSEAQSKEYDAKYKLQLEEAKLGRLKEEVEDLGKPKVCSECGQDVDNSKKKIVLEKNIKEVEKNIKAFTKELTSAVKEKEAELKRASVIETERSSKMETLQELRFNNEQIKKNREQRENLLSDIEKLVEAEKDLSGKLETYEKVVKDLEDEAAKFENISEQDYMDSLNSIRLIKETSEIVSEYNKLADLFKEKEALYLENKLKLQKEETEVKEDLEPIDHLISQDVIHANLKLALHDSFDRLEETVSKLEKELKVLEFSMSEVQKQIEDLTIYEEVTSRSGKVLKELLEKLTETFSNDRYRFLLDKTQATGKMVADLTMEYRVGKNWIQYTALSSGQKTMCDLYFITKVVTGVGIICLDETLRFLDDENMQEAGYLIQDIKKRNLIISTHSPNLFLEDIITLKCSLNKKDLTEVNFY